MRKQRKTWVMVLLIIVGAVVGSALWSMLGGVLPDILMRGISIGTTDAPLTVDFTFLKLTFGMVLHVNIGAILGIAAALLISLKL